jgi:predicted nucleic acid-binding protein
MAANFFDTNVLLYLASSDTEKADRAEQALASGGVISVQVLNELANVARKKMSLSWPEIRGFLSTIRGVLTVHPLTVEIHEAGMRLAEQHKLSVYDAMIAAAALDAGCDELWSEDLQHDAIIDGRLRIRNPFR